MKTLVVVPTLETFRRMRTLTMSAPMALDIDSMALPLMIVDPNAPLEAYPSLVYTDADVVDMKTAHQDGRYALVAFIRSEQLTQRCRNVGVEAPALFEWTLKRDVPPGRHNQAFVASLTDIMVYKEEPFSFTGELILTD